MSDKANFKAVTFNKNCSGLTGKCSRMPNVSYTNRWKNFHFLFDILTNLVGGMDKIISDNGLSGVLRIGATSSDLEKITSFYNTHFIKSQQKLKYKQKMYANTKRSPIILVIKDKNSEIIGLLESWNDKDNPSIKVLANNFSI